MKVSDTFTWPTGKELEKLGQNKYQQFRMQRSSPNIDVETVKHNIFNEWYEFDVTRKQMKLSEFFNDVLSNSDKFPVLG